MRPPAGDVVVLGHLREGKRIRKVAGADTAYRGIDIVSTLRQDWRAAGRTDFTLGYNRNRTTATAGV